jgi:hypothetical protein
MCIRIVNSNSENQYDTDVPLENQLTEFSHIRIEYEPKDPSLNRFLSEMQRLCKIGISTNVSVNFLHNNHLSGIKAKRQITKLAEDLNVNQAIKLLTKLQANTDRKLREMSEFCLKGNKRV